MREEWGEGREETECADEREIEKFSWRNEKIQ